jgi:hypothetical protein
MAQIVPSDLTRLALSGARVSSVIYSARRLRTGETFGGVLGLLHEADRRLVDGDDPSRSWLQSWTVRYRAGGPLVRALGQTHWTSIGCDFGRRSALRREILRNYDPPYKLPPDFAFSFPRASRAAHHHRHPHPTGMAADRCWEWNRTTRSGERPLRLHGVAAGTGGDHGTSLTQSDAR